MSNALIARLLAVGLLTRCLLLLLVLYLHLLYSVMWWLHTKYLRQLCYIVSIDTYNVYYVIMALNYFYDILHLFFYFISLNGHSKWSSLKALLYKVFSRCIFAFLVSFWYSTLLPVCIAAAAFWACYVFIMLAASAFASFDMHELYYLQ